MYAIRSYYAAKWSKAGSTGVLRRICRIRRAGKLSTDLSLVRQGTSNPIKILATYNIKGGVGKTAAAINLAWLAAQEGARTLVWDLDPQGASTFYFRVKPKIKGGGERLVDGRLV